MKYATKYYKKDYDILGSHLPSVTHKLKRQMILLMAQICGYDTCHKCKRKITTIKEMSIEHRVPWTNQEEFLDIENLALSHLGCNSSTANAKKGKIGKQYGYVGVCQYRANNGDYIRYKGYGQPRGKNKTTSIGMFKTPLEAAIAYDIAGIRCRNGNLVLNFPSLRKYYERLISVYPPESKETIFYQYGPIKGLVAKTIAENPEVFKEELLKQPKH